MLRILDFLFTVCLINQCPMNVIMNYRFNDTRSGIISALFELYKRDNALLSINANERSITHRFAIYIEKEFPGWDVDCEYNRDGEKTKKVEVKTSDGAGDKKTSAVLPDIIVHERGREGRNLLVIEAKKNISSNKKTERETDKQKICAYIEDYNYQTGLFIIFNVENRPLSADLEWYHDKTWRRERIDLEINVNKVG